MMKKAFLAAAFVVGSLGAGHATTVTNGSFEDNPLGSGGWDVYPGIPGWTVTSGSGIEIQSSGLLGFPAQDGSYYVELDSYNNSGISQSVSLSVGRYLLSFWYRPREGVTGTNGIDYSIAGLLATATITGVAPSDWIQVTAEFIVTTAGSYDLSFVASENSDSLGGLIDNVSIAAVPVPAGGLLLLGALGGLAALRRRKAIAA